MAKAGSSSRFVSVNLSKSYGQPTPPSSGHGSSVSSVSGSSSFGYRARLQSGHSGMVVLSRSGRSQYSVSSIGSRTSKLGIPGPVNLPSLRREHAGNDPTVPLVGTPGSSGWSKQQVMASPGNKMAASKSIAADSGDVVSSSIVSESSWSFPASQRKGIHLSEKENVEQRAPFYHPGASSYQPPSENSSLYIPPSSRNPNAVNLHPTQRAIHNEKAMVVRGEDFPTLQAAVRPLAVPALQRQRDTQQKQRDNQHELNDQHVKLHQLSQLPNTKLDVLQSKQNAGPSLQPSRPQQALLKPHSIAEGLPYNVRRTAEKGATKFNGPSPLIRLTHTSNWGDDERETLQSAHAQGLMQSDRLETGRLRNGFNWVDLKVDNDTGRPTSRSGSGSAYGSGHMDLRDINRNSGFTSEKRSMQETSLSNAAIKGVTNQQRDVDSWEDVTSWSKGPARSDPLKHDWSYNSKAGISNRDARFGNSSSSSNSKNMGSTRNMHLSALRDVGVPLRGDNLGIDKFTRDTRSLEDSNRVVDVKGDDGQGDKFKKRINGSHYGRSNMSSAHRVHAGARSDLLGLDYGRERRVSSLYGQDPFTDEPRSFKSNQPSVIEAFVGFSGFEAKIIKRKKDEVSSFHDPARELFEAELERVQTMQEQERQKLAEERERELELARKEEEERERLAREKEFLRLKLEEEAREAFAREQREQEEAARKAEETRRAREEQRRMSILEEERRKEAARRKLLELEQRIASRESGEGASTEGGRTEDVIHNEYRRAPRLDKHDKNEGNIVGRGALSMRKEFMDRSRSMTPPINSVRWPSASRGEEGFPDARNRATQVKRRQALDDSPGVHSVIKTYHRQDIPSPELDCRSSPLQEMSIAPTRSFTIEASQNSSIACGKERADSFSRKEHWQSGYGDKFSVDHLSTPLSTNANKGYMDSAIERESDHWWGRDNHRKFEEGQRLNSPPLYSYTDGGENEYLPLRRRGQSLPKQPKVPPPIFGRPSSHKQIIQSEPSQAPSPMHSLNNLENVSMVGFEDNSHEMKLERTSEKGDYTRSPYTEALSVEKPVSAPSNDLTTRHNLSTKLFDETAGGFEDVLQACKDTISQPDEIDQFSEQLSDLTESEEQSREDEDHGAVDMQASEAVAYADEEDGWVVQKREEDSSEDMCVKEARITEAVQADLEEQKWDSSKTHEDARNSLEHDGIEEEFGESTWESQHMEDEGNGVVDGSEGPADAQRGRDQSVGPMTGKQDEKHEEREGLTVDPRDVVKGGSVESQNNFVSANALEYAQAGQSEGHNGVHSFIQQFQQPFSFMAVPLPQSTTMNGVPLHPPMLPSMHNLPMQQDIPYPLQMGLFPSAPLMPNAIQIGSIQMPLQVHPQMPPVAHCHQQPPLFQFGQICQFSQPVPSMQPTFQMHQALGQPLLAQHHQADFLFSTETSQQSAMPSDPVKELEEVQGRPSSGSSATVGASTDSLVDGNSISKDLMDQSPDFCLGTAEPTLLPSVKLTSNKFSTPDADINEETNQDTLGGKITGGKRRVSHARSYGIYGRGRGTTSGPCSIVEALPENLGKERPQNRTNRQNIRGVEYKIRKLPPRSEVGSEVGLDQEIHDVPYGILSAENPANDGRLDSSLFTQSFGGRGTNLELIEAAPSVQAVDTGFKTTQVDASQARISSASNQIKGNITECTSNERRDTPLQDSVGFVFEQQGSEVYSNEDDFIEVRSKRHLLREQREMRDKIKIEGLKVKEHIASKQQKVIKKSVLRGEASMFSSGHYPAGKGSVANADMVTNGGRHGKHSTSVIGSNLQQSCVTSNSICSSTAANEPQVSKSSHYQSMAGTPHADRQLFEHGYSNDSTPAINAAWGVQKSSHEVVSSTQIQLEETRRPFGYDGISCQTAPITDRGLTDLEPGNLLASTSYSTVSAPMKNSFSMPGPISSLLAGEKIQFGAVTSPTVVSSSTHPPSPFIGAIGSQFGSNFSSHPSSLARTYFLQDSSDTFLPSNVTPRVDDDLSGQLVDAEAEAMAAASAVAVAAISNDEAVNSYKDANPALDGIDATGAGMIQASSKNLVVENIIAAALPADLSVENTTAPPQQSLPNHSLTSEIMLQYLPSRASPFPCLEMGTVIGGPIFAYGPREDAVLSPFESGLAGLGAGSVGGWQHRLCNTSDSFYGAPPPFISPPGHPSIQGHSHMLVYTNPFSPVGQFGQLGLSFMGTTYHPSGKQPDWTHTPYATSPASLNQSGGDVNAGRPPALEVQHSALASNSPQAISAAGCSMMPVPAPISVFDPNFASPFQAQWTRALAPPFSNYHVPGLAPSLDMQRRPSELGLSSMPMHISGNHQQLPETSGLHVSSDAAGGAYFPQELGFGYPVIPSNSVCSDVQMLLNKGLPTEHAEDFGGRLQQSQNMNGDSNLACVSIKSEPYISLLENPHAQGSELEQQPVLGHHPNTSSLVDRRAPEQAQGMGGLVGEWAGSNTRRASSPSIPTVSSGERGPASSAKLKQIYVAKPSTPVHVMDAT